MALPTVAEDPTSTTILIRFVVDGILAALYYHGFGKIMVDGRLMHGRCGFFSGYDFDYDRASGYGSVMSVSQAVLLFPIPRPSSCSLMLGLFIGLSIHMISDYLPIFSKNAHLDNVHVR
jgi:hypothetical protein